MSKKVKDVLNILGYDIKSGKGSYTLYIIRKNGKGEIVNKTLGYYSTIEALLKGLLEHKIMNEDLIHNVGQIIQFKQEIVDILKDVD